MNEAAEALAVADKSIRWGWIWFAGGSIITLVGYSDASAGGTYSFFWGPMVFGIYKIYKGMQLKHSIMQIGAPPTENDDR